MKRKILIVDDEKNIRDIFIEILSDTYPKDIFLEAVDGEEALNLVKTDTIDLVISDIKMPKIDGVELLEKIKSLYPNIPVIMISGHGDIQLAVECIKKGAYDYIPKPPDLNRLITSLKNALEFKTLKKEFTTLKSKVSKQYEILGSSEKTMQIHNLIKKVAPSDARILVLGPNGSGKELVAKNIHAKSGRAELPFVELNCAAIPSELIESELFGHEKGSFTGAYKQKIGKFELATEGTLFLDEIGDMSLSTQSKVLRALQENKITRVGGEKDIRVNPRILAATNKNLLEEIKKGNFREDLYHRLAVIIIEIPSLNDRKEDIDILVTNFINHFSEENKQTKTISAKGLKILKNMDWSGNVRELKNVIERLYILGSNNISEEDIKLYSHKN